MDLLDLMVKIGVDDQASGKIGGIASGIVDTAGSAIAGAGKVAAGVTAAAATGAAAIGSAALDSYGEYEQLAGGISKLYGDAADTVEANAQRAYATAGMTANEYMSNAMSVSAALISSVGGDTEKAAELTDVAMRAISDNVNTFGRDAESVTNAVIGMSRGNYTMLDNLSLGYSATAEGMLDLINDSGVLGETLTDTSQLADVGFGTMVEALQAVQEQQGIAGTTANEAATTIEGSLGMTQAAWQNLITELGKDDGDVGARVEELVNSASTALLGATDEQGNQVSEGLVGKLSDIFQSLADALPGAIEQLIPAIQTALPQIASTVMEVLPGLLSSLSTVVAALASQIGPLVGELVPVIIEAIPLIIQAGMDLFIGLAEGLNGAAPQIMDALFGALGAIVTILIENGPALLLAAGELFVSIVTALTDKRDEVMAALWDLMLGVVNGLVEGAGGLLTAAGDFFMEIVNGAKGIAGDLGTFISSIPGTVITLLGDLGTTLLTAGGDLIQGLLDGVTGIFNGTGDGTVQGFITGLPDKIKGFLDEFDPLSILVDVGTNIMQGLVNGITNFNLRDAIVGVFGDIGGVACDILGIQSPSKVFAEIGDFTMQGLAEGINDAAHLANEATQNAVEGVYGAASGTVDVSYANSGNNAILAALAGIRDNMSMSVYLDGQTLVGGIAPRMNYALGVM